MITLEGKKLKHTLKTVAFSSRILCESVRENQVQSAFHVHRLRIRGMNQLQIENTQKSYVIANMYYVVRPKMVVSVPNIYKVFLVVIP